MDPLSLDCSSDAEICRTIAAVESEDGKLVCRSPSKKRKSSSFEALESSASSIESPQALVPPTKPLSAIFTWMSQERSACKAENPDASPEEISAIMRAQWSGMSSRDKLVFVQQFNAAKVKYEKERALYEKNLEAHTASIRNTGVEIVPSNIIKGTIENIPVQRARDPVFERASKLSKTDAKMVSKRRLRDRVDDVPYDFELVPKARGCSLRSKEVPSDGSMLEGSVLLRVADRDAWGSALTEILQICNEAAWRRTKIDIDAGKDMSAAPPHDAKPLMLEYIADRLDTDDPIWGYQIRTKVEGWLQGFIIVTDFTTWASYFRFDSQAPSNGITADDVENRVTDNRNTEIFDQTFVTAHVDKEANTNEMNAAPAVVSTAQHDPNLINNAMNNPKQDICNGIDLLTSATIGQKLTSDMRVPAHGKTTSRSEGGNECHPSQSIKSPMNHSLASQLEAQPRWGDPEVEGVVFHTIAEISLLGALGCGAWLLQLVLQELKAMGRYKYAILQATDQAIPFYESMGFVRVGCVARHARGKKEEDAAKASKAKGKDSDALKKRGSKESEKKGKVHAPKRLSPTTEVSKDAKVSKKGISQGKKRAATSTVTSSLADTMLLMSEKKKGSIRKKKGYGIDPPIMPSDRGEEIRPEDAFYWLTIYMSYLVQKLRFVDKECIFHHPVSLAEVPDYLQIIPSRTPMDLSTMQRKVIAHRYENLLAFLDDVKLIAANALSYNKGTSIIYRRAKKIISEATALVYAFRTEVSMKSFLPRFKNTTSKAFLKL